MVRGVRHPPLYFATASLVIAVKAVVRRGRPPAVLLLGSSSARSSTLQLTVQQTVVPLVVTACLRHDSSSELLQQTFDFFSYRVSEADWRAVVTALVQFNPIVVVDARSMTEAVTFEVDLALREVARDRLFFLADSANHPGLPADRCFTVGRLVEGLDERLNRGFKKAPTRQRRIFRDRQNGYFTLSPRLDGG